MFKLLNVKTNYDLVVEVSNPDNKDDIIEFNISSIVNKKKQDELDADNQFKVLHAYLDYKGIEFKRELFSIYKDAEDIIISSITIPTLDPMPFNVVKRLFKLFDLDDVIRFVRDDFKLKPPSILCDSFDMQLEKDDVKTRAQTYTKNDYIELAGLSTVLKTSLPIIGYFGFIKNNHLYKIRTHYTLFPLIADQDIAESAPFQKLLGFTIEIIKSCSKSGTDNAIRVIEKKIGEDDLPQWALSSAIMQKVCVATLISTEDKKNLVNGLHSFISYKIRPRDAVDSRISSKGPLTNKDDGGSDPESIIESHKINTDITTGFMMELELSLSNIDMILYAIPKRLFGPHKIFDYELLKNVSPFIDRLHGQELAEVQVNILSWIFKSVIDPRGLKYVSLESIIRLMKIAFVILWSNDFKFLAILLTSYRDRSDGEVSRYNNTTGRKRIPPELKEVIKKLYPYGKTTISKSDEPTNVIEGVINSKIKEIYKYKWVPVLSSKYLSEVTEMSSASLELPADLRVQLTSLIIYVEECLIASRYEK
jgi:hypothetical protein